MAILSSQKPNSLDIMWSDPIGKMTVEQFGNSTKIIIDFYFSLPIVELLQEEFESFSFSIIPSKTKWEYNYFSGDINSMEKNIQEFFNSQLLVNKKLNSEYHGYFYTEHSLTEFISDEKISKLSRFNSKNKISDFAQIKSKKSKLKAEEVVTNKINYVAIGDSNGPFMDMKKNVNIEDPNNFKDYFKTTAGSYSISPLQIANVEFLKNKINRSFKGENSFEQEDKIRISDDKFPLSFWSLWKKMFKFDILKTENLPTTKIYDSKYFPCKVKAEIIFPKGSKSQQALSGLFLKNSMNVEMVLKKKNSTEKKHYYKNFQMVELLREMSRSDKDPKIKISSSEFSDKITVYNPNTFPLSCIHIPFYWNEKLESLNKQKEIFINVPAKETVQIEASSNSKNSSRFYETLVINGLYDQLLGIDILKENVPKKTISSKVSGINNKVSKKLSDPRIGFYRLNEKTLKIRISNIPPYSDQLKFYIRQIDSIGSGAIRSPGSKRSDFIFITQKPEIGNLQLTPETEISYLELVPGNYQILCDLYSGGSLIDTVDTIFTKDPISEAGNQGINFELKLLSSNADLSSELLIVESRQEENSNELINNLINNGTLPSPLDKTFKESFATSKKISRYLLERFNFENCETESLGVIVPGVEFFAKPTEKTTLNHVYTARQYVANIGQLISNNAPIRTSNNKNDYVVDFAKFKSSQYLNFQTIPQVTYSITEETLGAWPITALGQSKTGRVKTKKISKVFNVEPNIDSVSLVFDPIRKANILTWNFSWTFENNLKEEFRPIYWLITANYGGVSAPVSYQAILNLKNATIVDFTLGGALGTVTYYIHCIYPDGTIIKNLDQQSITIIDDKKINLTLGRGL
jgi:hypothetical protein